MSSKIKHVKCQQLANLSNANDFKHVNCQHVKNVENAKCRTNQTRSNMPNVKNVKKKHVTHVKHVKCQLSEMSKNINNAKHVKAGCFGFPNPANPIQFGESNAIQLIQSSPVHPQSCPVLSMFFNMLFVWTCGISGFQCWHFEYRYFLKNVEHAD